MTQPWIPSDATSIAAETYPVTALYGATTPTGAYKWVTPTVAFKDRESGAWVARRAVPWVRTGGAWVVRRPKRWNGTAWVDLP